MRTIVITKGLPASGKSSYARDYQEKNPNFKIVNKDSLRGMLDSGKWSNINEKHICACRDELVEISLLNGFDVILDDCNLNPAHENRMRELSKEMNSMYREGDGSPMEVEIQIVDFTQVSPEVCIERDRKRFNYVGEKAIMDMYEKFIKPKPPVVEYVKGLPDCLITDFDGTISHMTNRTAYEWDKVGSDRKDPVITDLISRYGEMRIIIVSGRNDRCRPETEKWLADNGVHYNELFMRKDGDMRKDVVVKREIYEREIKGKYNVFMVLDDRSQTVNGWRDLGLKTLQVSNGNF